MDRLSLLTAVDVRRSLDEQSTSATIAAKLGVPEAEAEAALREAEREDLVIEGQDESVSLPADSNRQRWWLSAAGRRELERLQDERRNG